jgi:hypothetical protein
MFFRDCLSQTIKFGINGPAVLKFSKLESMAKKPSPASWQVTNPVALAKPPNRKSKSTTHALFNPNVSDLESW